MADNFYDVKNRIGGKTSNGVPFSDFTNAEFAYRWWEKEKEDAPDLSSAMSIGDWAESVGLNDEDFLALTQITGDEKLDPIERPVPPEWTSSLDDKARLTFQGQTWGFGDEIMGALGAVKATAAGNKGNNSVADLYALYRDDERAKIKEFRTNKPIEALSYEIAGGVFSPGNQLKLPSKLKDLKELKRAAQIKAGKTAVIGAKPTTQAAKAAFGAGLVYGAGASEEDSVLGIAKDSVIAGVTSSIFGVGFQKAVPLFSKGKEKLASLFNKANKGSSSVATLRELKDTAYEYSKTSEGLFDNKDFNALYSKANQLAVQGHYTKEKDLAVTKALNYLKALKQNKGNYTLIQMDKVKQSISQLYTKNPEQVVLLDMADAVDDIIKTKGQQFPEIETARAANALYKKAEKLELSFNKARINTLAKDKASGVELYKQSVADILNNPKAIKYFSEEEKKLLEGFLEGNVADKTLKRLSGMKPSFQNFMFAVGTSAYFQNPIFLLSMAVGGAANRARERAIKPKAEELLQKLGNIPYAEPSANAVRAGTSAVAATNEEYAR